MPYNIQGNTISLPTEPFMHHDKHYVSLREVTESLGGNLGFDNDTKTATATIGPWTAHVEMANGNVNVTGSDGTTTPVSLTAEPYIDDNGEMFVPFDFFNDRLRLHDELFRRHAFDYEPERRIASDLN